MDNQTYVLLSDIRTLLKELLEIEREELRIARLLTGIQSVEEPNTPVEEEED